MGKIISYSLFEPKSINSHMRFWDQYNGFQRYWYNIPAVVIVNSIFYPDFKQKIHYSSNLKDNKLFEILELINSKFHNVELIERSEDYFNTEPTLWRYKPLFDKEDDLVLCRDIDSIPTEDELLSTRYFINNENYLVHTLRTHTNHTTPPTIILAGLCGFKPKKIEFIQGFDFEKYYQHFKNPHWGLDQNSLIGIFISKPEWTQKHFLDSPISTHHHKVGSPLIPCNSFNQDFYRTNVTLQEDSNLLVEYLNKQTTWAGEPTDIRGEKLKDLLSFDYESTRLMKECFEESSESIKIFYL